MPDLRLEMKYEMNRLDREIAVAYADIKRAQVEAETAVITQRDKGAVISLLLEAKDKDNKASEINRKKRILMAA